MADPRVMPSRRGSVCDHNCIPCRGGWRQRFRAGWVCVRCGTWSSAPLPRIQRDGVHTIPVPRGWTPEQAWEAIVRGDELADPEPFWANVIVRNGRFVELVDA